MLLGFSQWGSQDQQRSRNPTLCRMQGGVGPSSSGKGSPWTLGIPQTLRGRAARGRLPQRGLHSSLAEWAHTHTGDTCNLVPGLKKGRVAPGCHGHQGPEVRPAEASHGGISAWETGRGLLQGFFRLRAVLTRRNQRL